MLSPIESHNSRDEFTNNSAKFFVHNSFLTPQLPRNLFAFSPKSINLTHEKKARILKKKITKLLNHLIRRLK